jgi:hypothetical protein
MNNVAGWDEIKESLPIGSMVSCVATRHAPFGVFVRITGVPFDGLIQITDFKDMGRMAPDEFPAIGTSLKAVVLGFKETGRQIWLGAKPSQIDNADRKTQGSNVPRKMSVGLRIRPDSGFEFFGIDEVNSLLKQGAKIIEVEPCEAIMTRVGETEEKLRVQLGTFSVNLVLVPSAGESSD